MKVGTVLLRRPGRWPIPEHKVVFKELVPLRLKNSVSGKEQKSSDVSCLQEMAVMFACMKKHEFKEAKCSPEINEFMACYNQSRAEALAVKKREESGEITVGRNPRDLTARQLTQLLQKYPQYNEKI